MPKGGKEKPKQKEKGPLSPEDFAKKMEAAKSEAESRGERLEKLRAKVAELFPSPEQAELRKEIEASFDVPQLGDYHNEGMLMDTHLETILSTADAIADGTYEWPAELPEDTRKMISGVIGKNRAGIERYVLLHDIAKKDALRLNTFTAAPEGGKNEYLSVTAAEWRELVPEEARRDPAKLLAYLQSDERQRKVVGVSYFHKVGDSTPSGKTVEADKLHGMAGRDAIEALGNTGVDALTLRAIERHEVGFQFTYPDVGKYREFFGDLTPEERDMVTVSSFLDLAGSFRAGSKPEFGDFYRMLASRRLFENPNYKEGVVSRALFTLRTRMDQAKLGQPFDMWKEIESIEQELIPKEYDQEKLRSGVRSLLEELVAGSKMKGEELEGSLEEIVAGINAGLKSDQFNSLGKKFGRFLAKLREIATASEKKG
ncbi:MAG: hypothetical protein WC551_07140 [Patescibacteria group bacterium]